MADLAKAQSGTDARARPAQRPFADARGAVRTGIVAPVQYLRVAAAFAVFFYHISASADSAWADAAIGVDAVGAAGVDLFFVLSGFIMAKIVAEAEPFDTGRFVRRRILRIVPLYWLVSLFVFALALSLPGLFNNPPDDWSHLVHSLLFLPYQSDGYAMAPVVLVGWTLNYEMFFYVLVALCAGLLGDRNLVVVRALMVAMVAGVLVAEPENHVIDYFCDPIILEFTFGIAIYHIYRESGPSRSPLYPALFVAGIVVLMLQLEHHSGVMRVLYWGVPSAAILLGGLHALRFESRILMAMADWSYALYLTHLFVIMAFVRFVIPLSAPLGLPWQIHYAVMTIAAIALAAVTHRFAECHAQRVFGRLLFGPRRR